MCDYSLQNVKSRAAKVGDKLTTRNFGTGTRGFAASEDASLAVCVLPGTELSFSNEVTCQSTGLFTWRNKVMKHTTAIIRQVNKQRVAAHHDASMTLVLSEIVAVKTCGKNGGSGFPPAPSGLPASPTETASFT
jgi:hypothetical protein